MTEIVCGIGGWTGPLPGDPSNDIVLSATSVFGGIDVTWGYPSMNPFAIAHVLLYRNTSNNATTATQRVIAAGNFFHDAIEVTAPTTYYYWIQVVSVHGTVGSRIGPASAIARPSIDTIITQLSGRIEASQLGTSLRSSIGNITLNAQQIAQEIQDRTFGDNAISSTLLQVTTNVNSNNALLLREVVLRADGDGALAAEITSLGALGEDNAAAILTERSARMTADAAMTYDIVKSYSAVGLTGAAIFGTDSTKVGYSGKVADANGNVTPYEGNNSYIVYPDTTFPTATYPHYALDRKRIIDKVGVDRWNAASQTPPLQWYAGLPLAYSMKQIGISDGTTNSDGSPKYLTLEQRAVTQKNINGELYGQYSVKIDAGGRVAGFGLSNTVPVAESGTSRFIINADSFSISQPLDYASVIEPTSKLAIGKTWFDENSNTTKRVKSLNPTVWEVFVPISPFIVDTTTGITYIKEAMIASLSADKITAGTLRVGSYIQSSSYNYGVAGWKISADGKAEFSGTLTTGAATTFSAGIGLWSGFNGDVYQFRIGNPAEGGSYLAWDGTTIFIAGNLRIGAAANSPSLASLLSPIDTISVKGFSFKRSVEQPSAPAATNGSFSSPNAIIDGWGDGIPADDGTPVWMTTRIFTPSGKAPQQASWTTPSKVGNQTSSMRYVFSVNGTIPGVLGDAITDWHLVPAVADIYMATQTTLDGQNWGAITGKVKIKGETGASGAPALRMDLSNDTHNIPCNADGTETNYAASGTEIRVYDGAVALAYDAVGTDAGTWKITSITGTGISNASSITDSGTYATVGVASSMTDTAASILFKASGKTANGTPFSDLSATQSFAKVSSGDSAIVYYIHTTASVISKAAPDAATSGVHSPSSFTVTGKKVVGNNAPVDFGYISVVAGDVAVNWPESAPLSKTVAITDTANVTHYVARMYTEYGGTLLDTETIPVVFKGATGAIGAAVVLELSNDSATVSTNFDGTGAVVSGDAFKTIASVYVNGTLSNTGWTFSWASSTLTPATATGNTYQATGISADNAFATVTAEHATYGRKTAVFNITKVRTGTSGTQYWLATNANSIKKSVVNSVTTYTPSTVTFTPMKQEGTETPKAFSAYIKYVRDGTERAWGVGNSFLYSDPQNDSSALTVRMYDPTGAILLDSETVPILVDGAAGPAGAQTAIVYAYKRSAYTPSPKPGAVTYTFSDKTYTADPNGWLQNPALTTGTDQLWVCAATAYGTGATDAIAATDWSDPVKGAFDGKDGNPGLNVATVTIWRRTASNTTPTAEERPYGAATFTFATGALVAADVLNQTGSDLRSWSVAVPASSSGKYLWAMRATAANTTATDNLLATEFSAPVIFTQDGLDSTVQGPRGAITINSSAGYYQSNTIQYRAWAVAVFANESQRIKGDTAFMTNPGIFTIIMTWDGSEWQEPRNLIDGSLLVSGSVTASAMHVNSITAVNGAIAALTVDTLQIKGGAVIATQAIDINLLYANQAYWDGAYGSFTETLSDTYSIPGAGTGGTTLQAKVLITYSPKYDAPWGQAYDPITQAYSTVYHPMKFRLRKVKNGQWIELGDFTGGFNYIDAGPHDSGNTNRYLISPIAPAWGAGGKLTGGMVMIMGIKR